jgi:hypothetical protein
VDWGQVAVGAGALVAGLLGGRWTRQSAKESNAGQLYSGFSDRQTAELNRLASRLAAVEQDRDEDREKQEREREEARREREAVRLRNREHMRWDWTIVRRLRAALPDEEFPDPPPLDL